jgi:hypothetical protein
MRSALVVAAMSAAVLLTATHAASALTWGPAQALRGSDLDVDAPDAPVVDVNTKGEAIVTWVGTKGRLLGAHLLARGSRSHPFKELREPRFLLSGRDPLIAIGPKGNAIVEAFGEDSSMYALISARGKVGSAHRYGKGLDIAGLVPLPDGSFLSIDTGKRLGATRISAAGKRGARKALGPSDANHGVDIDRGPAGQVIVHTANHGRHVLHTYSPKRGWTTVSVALDKGERVDDVVVAAGRFLLLTKAGDKIAVREIRGRAVRRGPVLSTGDAAIDARARFYDVRLGEARKSVFGVGFGVDGTALAPAQLGTRAAKEEPTMLFGPWGAGAMIAWSDGHDWGFATEHGGAFAPATPLLAKGQGALWPIEDGTLSTAGDAAALAWQGHHHVWVSVAKP